MDEKATEATRANLTFYCFLWYSISRCKINLTFTIYCSILNSVAEKEIDIYRFLVYTTYCCLGV